MSSRIIASVARTGSGPPTSTTWSRASLTVLTLCLLKVGVKYASPKVAGAFS